MKRKLEILLFTVFCSLLFGQTVEAKEIPVTEIENGSYIIGQHLFTKEYKTISTATYMLAAKSIASNQLEDMIIYYKDWNGSWINASTGDSVSVPEQFTIHYINLQTETEIHQEDLEKALSLEGILDYTSDLDASRYFSSKSYQAYLDAVDLGMDEQYGETYRYRSVEEHILAITTAKDHLLVQKTLLQLGDLLEQAGKIDRTTHIGKEEDFLTLETLLPLVQEKYIAEAFAQQSLLEQEISGFRALLVKFQWREQVHFDRVYQEFNTIYQRKEQLTNASVEKLSNLKEQFDQRKISLSSNEDLLSAIEQMEKLMDELQYLEEEYLVEGYQNGTRVLASKQQISLDFKQNMSVEEEAIFTVFQEQIEKQRNFLDTHSFREMTPVELRTMASEYETSYLDALRVLFLFLYEQIGEQILPNSEMYLNYSFIQLQTVMVESASLVSRIDSVSLSELEHGYQKLLVAFQALERV